MKPTRRQFDALDWAVGMKGRGMSLLTGRVVRLSVVRACMRAGWMKSVGMVQQTTDEGFLRENCREREAYTITYAGMRIYRRRREQQRRALERAVHSSMVQGVKLVAEYEANGKKSFTQRLFAAPYPSKK